MSLSHHKTITLTALLSMFFAMTSPVGAADFSSTDFTVVDPVLSPSGYSSSDDFQLQGNVFQVALGTSSAASFGNIPGFLPFIVPSVIPPVIPPTSPLGGGILGLIQKIIIPSSFVAVRDVCEENFADLNCDGAVNFQDLSIFLFLKPTLAPSIADLNSDKKVDTKDLSILFSHWSDRIFSFKEKSVEPQKYIVQTKGEIFEEIEPQEHVASVGAVVKPPLKIIAIPEDPPRTTFLGYIGDFFSNIFNKVVGFFGRF